MSQKTCPQCGYPLSDDAIFCPECGKNLSVEKPQQPNQQPQQPNQQPQQPNQQPQQPGQPQPQGPQYVGPAPVYPMAQRNKTLAGVLAIILGGFGVHYFYLNKMWAGMACLVFTTLSAGFSTLNANGFGVKENSLFLWAPAILGLITGIRILTASQEQFERRYVYTAHEFPI